jgi:hypothetical protein
MVHGLEAFAGQRKHPLAARIFSSNQFFTTDRFLAMVESVSRTSAKTSDRHCLNAAQPLVLHGHHRADRLFV